MAGAVRTAQPHRAASAEHADGGPWQGERRRPVPARCRTRCQPAPVRATRWHRTATAGRPQRLQRPQRPLHRGTPSFPGPGQPGRRRTGPGRPASASRRAARPDRHGARRWGPEDPGTPRIRSTRQSPVPRTGTRRAERNRSRGDRTADSVVPTSVGRGYPENTKSRHRRSGRPPMAPPPRPAPLVQGSHRRSSGHRGRR